VSVRHQLAGFITLQRLLDRRAALQRERETPPEELRSLRAGYVERAGELGKLQVEQQTLMAERASLQDEVVALKEEREHFRHQKTQVTNMRQLTAVVSELDHVESQLKPREERLLEITGKLQGIEGQIASLGEEAPEEKAIREKAEAIWTEARKAGEVEFQEVERELRQVQRELGAAAMVQFKKLWSHSKPLAVVPMEGEACSACHADLRPSLVQLVRTMEELQYCDSCRRVLFDPELFSATP
jgi:predicted  nucleic acid-binding Zn-ribbon protein